MRLLTPAGFEVLNPFLNEILRKAFGEVSEWLKEHAWKACGRREVSREFESLPLRSFYLYRKTFYPNGEGFSKYGI